MTLLVLDDGRPLFARGDDDRIGRGPWSRWLASAIVRDESSLRAERGRSLAREGHVHSVTIAEGRITADVVGSTGLHYRVEVVAEPISSRVWASVADSPRGRDLLHAARLGLPRAVQLEHTLAVDWESPLVPRARDIHSACSCPYELTEPGRCKHVAALAYVLADRLDDDLAPLLHWRGCAATLTEPAPPVPRPEAPVVATRSDPWEAGAIPPRRTPRALPVGAVVKRLGRSGVGFGETDLADLLMPAYAALAATDTPTRDAAPAP